MPVKDFLESVIEDGVSGEEGETSDQMMEEWEAVLDEFAEQPGFRQSRECFVDDGREGIY